MFGIGLGEILLILFIIFIVSPRDIPRMIRKIGQAFSTIEKIRGELSDVEREVKGVVKKTSSPPATRSKQENKAPGKRKTVTHHRKAADIGTSSKSSPSR
jgi:Sec-independent protein translocase protein TatA